MLGPVGWDPGWRAALTGGLLGGVAGTLAGDSGPLPLVLAVGALACILCYLRGRPAPTAGTERLTAAGRRRPVIVELAPLEAEQPLAL